MTNWGVDWLTLEGLVTLFEALGYLQLVPLRPGRAVLLALCANLLTACAALLWWGLSL